MPTTVIFLNPDRTRFFKSSQPMPPAPTTNIGVVITFWPSDGGSTAGAFSATCETSDPAMIKEQLSLSPVNALV